MNTRIRRATRLRDQIVSCRNISVQELCQAQARLTWHIDQYRARKARYTHHDEVEGTPASHAVAKPTPHELLHVQWDTATYTPYEYQTLVRNSTWMRELREHREEYYRLHEAAPCGAD